MKDLALALRAPLLASILLGIIILPAHATDLDPEALWLTLLHQEGILLDTSLCEEITTQLNLAKSVNDTLDQLYPFESFHQYELIVDVLGDFADTSWAVGELITGVPVLDSLGELYGLSYVDGPLLETYYVLGFNRPMNMVRLGNVYDTVPELMGAGANSHFGEGDEILLTRRPEAWYFSFSMGWGECEVGCLNRRWWYVRVADGIPTQEMAINLPDYTLQDGSIPRWNLYKRAYVGFPLVYDNVTAMLDTIADGSTWWAREHAMMTSVSVLHNRNEYVSINDMRVELLSRLGELHATLSIASGDDDASLAGYAHEMLLLTLPPFPFPYYDPEPPTEVATSDEEYEFSWRACAANTFADSIVYEVTIPGLEGVITTDQTSISTGEIVDSFSLNRGVWYPWRVAAQHLYDPDRRTQVNGRKFMLYENLPLASFDLIEPENNLELTTEETSGLTMFNWSSARPGVTAAMPYYDLYLEIPEKELLRTFVTPDTFGTIGLYTLLGLHNYSEPLTLKWYVKAHNNDEILQSESVRYMLLMSDQAALPDEIAQGALPSDYEFQPPYPNPFNPSVTITVGLPKRSMLQLEVYNLLGQRVATLSDGVQDAGWITFSFNGSGLASGVYLLHAMVPNKLNQTRCVTLVR